MVKTKVEITKEDLQKIDDLKNGIGCLSKEIMYTDENNESYCVGLLSISPQRIAHEGRILKDFYVKVSLSLAGYEDEPEIKSLSGLEYVTKSEYLDKSLMMKHSLVNPREGEEVEVEIIKLDC